jgi:hypothetical protein
VNTIGGPICAYERLSTAGGHGEVRLDATVIGEEITTLTVLSFAVPPGVEGLPDSTATILIVPEPLPWIRPVEQEYVDPATAQLSTSDGGTGAGPDK